MTVVIVGILFIVGLLIFAKVDIAAENLLDTSTLRVANETLISINIVIDPPDDSANSTLLTQLGYVVGSARVFNNTGSGIQLKASDFTITLADGAIDGDISARANFTLDNVTHGSDATDERGFNGSTLSIFYTRHILSDAQNSIDIIESTVLDSFELGVIVLIVLAAVVILTILFRLGTS